MLGSEPVGVTDDFFALGGDSLGAAEAMEAAACRLGREIPLRLLFAHPTIERLAARIRDGELPQERPIVRAERRAVIEIQ